MTKAKRRNPVVQIRYTPEDRDRILASARDLGYSTIDAFLRSAVDEKITRGGRYDQIEERIAASLGEQTTLLKRILHALVPPKEEAA